MNKFLKRSIAGGLSIVMAASILFSHTLTNVVEVQAKTKVFDKITEKYKPTGTFTILEIVPESDSYSFTISDKDQLNERGRAHGETISVKKNAEMGYFIAKQPLEGPYKDDNTTTGEPEERPINSVAGVSRAGRYGSPTMRAEKNDAYENLLWNMYQYGMVKPTGTDQEGVYNRVGEYPIFSWFSVFSIYPSQTATNPFKRILERGYYTENTTGDGKYILADGYKLDEDGTICKVTISMNEIPSISDNTTVSNNEPEYEEVEVLEPVTDINTTEISLPTSTSGFEYIVVAPSKEVQNDDGTTKTVYSGNLDFTRSEGGTTRTLYYGFSDRTLYYSVSSERKYNYTNSDWFREYVFGDNLKYRRTKIDYRTINAKDVKVTDITSADLIYVSGSDEMFTPTTNDISNEVMIALFNRVVTDHKAVMMDYKLYNSNLKTNISKLCLLLWQNEQSASYTKVLEDYEKQTWFDTDTKKLVSTTGLFKDENMTNFLKKGLNEIVNGNDATPLTTNGNFVRGNLYVYNHHRDDFVKDAYGKSLAKSQVDAEDNFANGDFATAYSSDVTMSGFSEVVNYITNMNNNSLTGQMIASVTPAVAIQYILVTDGQPITLMKNTLRILELEPCPSYLFNYNNGSMDYVDLDDIVQLHDAARKKDENNVNGDFTADGKIIAAKIKQNRKDFVTKYLSSYYSDDIDDVESTMLKYISFTSMCVSEFNGHNEDLVENYDIIYIGDQNHRNMWFSQTDTKNIKTFKYTKPFLKTDDKTAYGVTTFRDSAMDGNVYFNMGDITDVYAGRQPGAYAQNKSFLSGYIDGEKYGEQAYAVTDLNEDRFSARDISRNKLNKLEEFLKANGLVIVDGDIYGYKSDVDSYGLEKLSVNPTGTAAGNAAGDHGRLDNSSNMYEFIQFGRGYVYNYSMVDDEKNKIPARSYVPNTDAQGAKISYENMVSAAYLEKNPDVKDDYNKYVSSDRLNLIMTSWPTPYSYECLPNSLVIDTDKIEAMTHTEDGVPCLEYKFSIGKELNSTINPLDTYIATLYFDLNNDGKYSKTTEKIDDCTVLLDSTNGVQPAKNANGEYLLNLNANYVLKRKLSEEFAGLIKWKLEIKSTVDLTNHATQEGYTLIRPKTGEDKDVRILQICPDNSCNLDLAKMQKDNNNTWSSYLNNVPGYDVNIKSVKMTDFENDFVAKYTAYKNNPNNPNLSLADYANKVYFDKYELVTGVEGKKDVIGVNMLVIGFGDDIQAFKQPNAIDAIAAFISYGKPVLMTHDVVGWYYPNLQNVRLRSLIGMDKYGVTQNIKTTLGSDNNTVYSYVNKENEPVTDATTNIFGDLHQSSDATTAKDQAAIIRMESFIKSLNKEVAYQPGSDRKTISYQKSGYSSWFTDWENVADQQWSEAPGTQVPRSSENSFNGYNIVKMNGGQITEFPYRLPDTFSTNITHSQYFELDMSVDADNDGESDVVVWYTLGTPTTKYTGSKNSSYAYDDSYGGSLDPANGYYIYNDGNVTYTGAGHHDLEDRVSTEPKTPEIEKQLFVNTLLAAFDVGNQSPAAGFYETTKSNPTTCLVVPYDQTATEDRGTGVSDSSSLKNGNNYLYKFVDPNTSPSKKDDGTKMYFRVSDPNLVRGTKSIYSKFYLKIEDNMKVATTGSNSGNTNGSGNETNKVVGIYGTNLPVVTINGVEVVDISRYIRVYNVDQDTGVFDENPIAQITDVKEEYSNNDLSATKDNRPNWLYGVKGLQSGMFYGLYLPMTHLEDNASFTIYMENMTSTTSISTAGEQVVAPDTPLSYQKLAVTKADLLYLN